MKKSELRKLVKQIISEQGGDDPFDTQGGPGELGGVVAPIISGPNAGSDEGRFWVKCPKGYEFMSDFHDFGNINYLPAQSWGANSVHRITGCARLRTVAEPVKGLDTGTSGPYQVD